MTVVAYESANALPHELFEELWAPWALTRVAELRRLEEFVPAEAHYLLAVEAGQSLALLPTYVCRGGVPAECDPAAFGVERDGPVLLLGSVGGYANHLAVRRKLPAERARAATRALLDAALRLGPTTAVLPHLTAEQDAVVALPVTANRQDLRAVLDLTWTGFDGYAASLPHKRRAGVRRERERFLSGRPSLSVRPLGEVATQIAPLLAAVERRYGRNHGPLRLAWYLEGIAEAMGDQGVALLLESGGRPVAFSVLWTLTDEWHVRAWGCDDAVVGRSGTYFNLAIYEPAVRAAAAGARVLHLGTGTLEAKLRRGARAVPLVSRLLEVSDRPSPL